MSIKVSVIVPIYNSEEYLDECLNSIIKQSLKEIEIILINDGSKDNSLNICRKFKNKDDRIILLNQENSGVSVSRNNGIRISKGEYIIFVDSDDYLEEKMVEKLYNEIQNNKCDLVQCNNYLKYNSKNIKSSYNFKDKKIYGKNEFLKVFVEDNILDGKVGMFLWNKIFSSNIIKENNINFENIILEDYLFIMEYSRFVNKFEYINETLYNYRILENSLSKTFNKSIFKNLIYVDKRKRIFAEDIFINNDKVNEKMDSWFVRYLESSINSMFLFNNNNISEKKEYLEYVFTNDYIITILKRNKKKYLISYVYILKNMDLITYIFAVKNKFYLILKKYMKKFR
ncbi:glycosyltransferase [Clostridium perfringens]|uniref:glycosyltransferase family 2 protein n=1 Tax=Clostridium perfringens TaxID=1502 RepID=UPI0018E43AA9|nr:glycosyltransferase [Clostridium perfringens]MBI6001594.1 glycosyltransferase [Clostridium perfringens]MDK0710436.1 glycosyltransferase [Clostridium perfringens]MDK0713315.1 glycosyltransferase [Clostridium perfringens]